MVEAVYERQQGVNRSTAKRATTLPVHEVHVELGDAGVAELLEALGTALDDRLAEQLYERRVDAWVRVASRREQ
jgi:hypothetical protein